jgi:CcmD family protein
MGFMIAAYAVFWIVTFLFVLSIFNRQRNVRRDLEMVEQLLDTLEKANQK